VRKKRPAKNIEFCPKQSNFGLATIQKRQNVSKPRKGIVQETPQKKTKVNDVRDATFNFVWMLSLLFPAKFPTIQPIICPSKFLIGPFLATWPKYWQVGHSEKRPGLPV
jgi:hypothetical protein